MSWVNDDPATVECPARTCGAQPGNPCRTSTGATRDVLHGLRWLWLHRPGPLVLCRVGPCLRCWWTGWVPAVPTDAEADAAERARLEGFLHSHRIHPDYEYTSTSGQRKAWTGQSDPPDDRDGWEVNRHVGRDGWERFDYHEEAYWMRRRD